jgi:hypothetical protein
MQPQTIDDVIARLESIIDDAVARGDRIGYFAALYNRVTLAVRDGIRTGQFHDGPRMERLDVTFATRFLDALDAWRAGQLPSRVWLKAFEATLSPTPVILQHLLAAMNAHITLDLGIAAARTCPGAELPGLKTDFDRINTVLASLTPTVEGEIGRDSPEFALLSRVAPALENHVVGFAMDDARAMSWSFASSLAPLPLPQQVPLIARRDDEAAFASAAILADGIFARVLRHKESTDVAANIRSLAQGEFRISVAAADVATAASLPA